MSKSYIWIATEILEESLKLPEGVRIEGVMHLDIHRGVIGLIVSGEGLPTNGETMNELVAVYKSTREGDFSFLEWRAPG